MHLKGFRKKGFQSSKHDPANTYICMFLPLYNRQTSCLKAPRLKNLTTTYKALLISSSVTGNHKTFFKDQ